MIKKGTGYHRPIGGATSAEGPGNGMSILRYVIRELTVTY